MILTLPQIEVFLLILARIAGLFLQTPVLSTRSFPALGKIALATWMSAILWFTIPNPAAIPPNAVAFILAIVNEFVIGFLIGFVCYILFAAIQAAGDIMDLQMGLSVATAFDPIFGSTITLIGRLCYFISLVIFLIVNGHHLILTALQQSFRIIPLAMPVNITAAIPLQLISLSTSMWLIAAQLSAPVVVIIFLSDFAFGIVSRVAPQVNVFMLGFQVKPALGLWALLMALPLFINHVSMIIQESYQEIIKLLYNLR